MQTANGNLEVIKWLVENGFSCGKFAIERAARVGSLDAVKWLYQILENSPAVREELVTSQAASSGNLELLKWLLVEKKMKYNPVITHRVASSGNVEALKWILSFICHCDKHPSTCRCLPYGSKLIEVALSNLKILKYCREELKCEWCPDAFGDAVKKGKLKILRWLVHHGCPVNAKRTVQSMVPVRPLEHIMLWLVEDLDDELKKIEAPKPVEESSWDSEEEERKRNKPKKGVGQKIFDRCKQDLMAFAIEQKQPRLLDLLERKGVVWTEEQKASMRLSSDPRIRQRGVQEQAWYEAEL